MSFYKKDLQTIWKNILLKDWQAKVGSLGVAVLLWWFVYSQTNVQQAWYIPIEYINLPPHMVILKTNDTVAKVGIQGRKDRIMNIKSHQIRAFVDLSHATKGWNTNQIQVTSTELDNFLSVNLDKTVAIVFIDTLEMVNLPIVPRIIETVEKEYEIESIELRPSSVIIQGPSTMLSNLHSIETLPISLKGISNSLTTNVTLALLPGIKKIDDTTNLLVIRLRPSLSYSNQEEDR